MTPQMAASIGGRPATRKRLQQGRSFREGGHGPFYPPYLLVLLVLVAPFPAIAFASPNQSLKQQFLKSAWPETEVACFEREVRRFVR